MEIKYGSYTVYYGANIQVFKGAHLEIGGDASVNVGLNLICANHISIGRWTGGGRNVTYAITMEKITISIERLQDLDPHCD